MTAAAMIESPALADRLLWVCHELHPFFTHLQKPRLADGKWADAARRRCRELSEKVASLKESVAEHQKALDRALEGISRNLRGYAHELEESRNAQRLREMYQSLAQGYELLRVELAAFRKEHSLRNAFPVQRLKTTNYARNLFHITMGVTAVLVYEYLLTRPQASILVGSLLALFLSLEISRRFFPRFNDFMVDRLFGAISRPWERHQTNSATYYTLGLVLVALFFPKPAAQMGVLVLAFGDPAATMAGKRWGRWKIWQEKSWVGVGAFLAAALAATVGFALIYLTSLPVGSRVALACSVTAVGAVVELFSERIDDNLTVPVACGAVASLWFL